MVGNPRRAVVVDSAIRIRYCGLFFDEGFEIQWCGRRCTSAENILLASSIHKLRIEINTYASQILTSALGSGCRTNWYGTSHCLICAMKVVGTDQGGLTVVSPWSSRVIVGHDNWSVFSGSSRSHGNVDLASLLLRGTAKEKGIWIKRQ